MNLQEAADLGTALAARLTEDVDIEVLVNTACESFAGMTAPMFHEWVKALTAHGGDPASPANDTRTLFRERLQKLNMLLAKRTEFQTVIQAFHAEKNAKQSPVSPEATNEPGDG